MQIGTHTDNSDNEQRETYDGPGEEQPMIDGAGAFTKDQMMLQEVLQKIGISEKHWDKFFSQEIGMYDFFLLRKEDLVELKLPIAARNRILAF